MGKKKIELVQLHTHSHSVRDSMLRLDNAIVRAKELGQTAYALTDHGVLSGIPELFRTCRKHGIKPIAGLESYLSEGNRGEPNKHFHQILIAKNKEGWHNLIKLSSEGFMTGFYGKPRIDMKLLRQHSKGLIATSACLAGIIPQAIADGDYNKARKLAQEFKGIFGSDFYLELQPNDIPLQKIVNNELVKISSELDIELIVTGDVHYVYEDDKTAHNAILCLGRQQKMLTDKEQSYDGNTYYIQSAKEMFIRMKQQGFEEEVIVTSISNTKKIADEIDFDLVKEGDLLPKFPLPEGQEADKVIGEMVKEGLMRKVKNPTKQYIDRIKFELGVIREKGYSDYFLITADAIKFCKRENIMVAPGRGSGAGSLVAYLLDITEVDPIEHKLFFERFLDISRQKMPDIDTDIQDNRRYEVIEYLKNKYGSDKVAQVTNYGKMSGKSALKSALQVYDIPFAKSQEITSLVPEGVSIEEAYEINPKLKSMGKQTVKNKANKTIKFSTILDVAERFEGVLEKFSRHAGGILITPESITERFPVFGTPEERKVQWDKDDVEDLGGVKFDFLGLKTLTVIGIAIDSIEKEHGIRISPEDIYRSLDDEATYKRIAEGKTNNTFQFNSSGMQDLCKAVKPSKFEHLVAINALYRPPALASGDTWRYARIKNGQEEEYYSHPDEKEITGETFGIITYQEHVMQLVHKFAGWSYNEGQKLRKKSQEELRDMRRKFTMDCMKNGYRPVQMNEIWDRIVRYMGYGFNKSHGVAYSMISFLTAYLEEHYPEHYMSAIMTVKMADKDKIAQVFQEVKRQGFDFQVPDINKGTTSFTASGGKIVFPISVIKGVGDGAVEEILEKAPFSDLEDLMERVDKKTVSAKAMKPLILAGAFDSVYPTASRRDILAQYYKAKGDKKKYEEALEMNWSKEIRAEHEKDLIGVYLSFHPMSKYHFRNWNEYENGFKEALAGGRISKVKSFNDKKGNRMSFVSIDTLEGNREIVVFHNVFSKYEYLLKEGNVVMIEGRKDGEKLIANKIKELS